MASDRFDQAKDKANLNKHGLSLMFGEQIFGDPDHLIISSFREIDGEERFKSIGEVEGKLFTCVFVWRSEIPRFISVRRSNTSEQKKYYSNPG